MLYRGAEWPPGHCSGEVGRTELNMRLEVGAVISLLALASCGGAATTAHSHTPTPVATPSPVARTPLAVPTATPSPPTPTPVPVIPYPPTTSDDLQALADAGNASAIQEFHSESVGLATCPEPKREVVVAPSLTGEKLAEDLLAYWFAQQLNNSCGSLVLAYHNQSEAGNAYTAGSLNLTVTGSSNSLEIDIGSALVGNQQVYTVTY